MKTPPRALFFVDDACFIFRSRCIIVVGERERGVKRILIICAKGRKKEEFRVFEVRFCSLFAVPLPRQKKKKKKKKKKNKNKNRKNDASARDLLAVSLRQDIDDDDEWREEDESDHVAVFNVETGKKKKKKKKKKRMCVRVVVNEKRFFFRRRRRRRRRRKRAAERLGDAGTRALGFDGVRVGRPGIRRV